MTRMEPETKKQETPKEFQRFEELAKKLVSVPKKDIKDREKDAKDVARKPRP
jgi:hypothetical protein